MNSTLPKHLRRVFFRERQWVESLRLTNQEYEYLKHIAARGYAYSTDMVGVFGVSIQAANVVLSRLRFKGYVTRQEVGDPTGGKMFKYELAEELR